MNHKEHDMARANFTAEETNMTDQEKQLMYQWALKNHIILDGELGAQQGQLVSRYFWGRPITPESLDAALPILRPYLKFYAKEDIELAEIFGKLSEEELEIATTTNLPGELEETKHNLIVLLRWVIAHGFKVTRQSFQQAAGQRNMFGLLQWRPVRSQRSKFLKGTSGEDDKVETFTNRGLRKLPDGSFGRTALDIKREANAASEAALRSVGQVKETSSLQSRAKSEAESLRGRTHSETAQIRRIFVFDSNHDVDWVATLNARQKVDDRSIR
jgi:hypothetical protein